MKFWGWTVGLLVLAAFVLALVTRREDARHVYFVTGPWWIFAGVALGIGIGAVAGFLTARPWRWKIKLHPVGASGVQVRLSRLGESTTVATLKPEDDDFDDQLHAAVSEARAKALAMDIAAR